MGHLNNLVGSTNFMVDENGSWSAQKLSGIQNSVGMRTLYITGEKASHYPNRTNMHFVSYKRTKQESPGIKTAKQMENIIRLINNIYNLKT